MKRKRLEAWVLMNSEGEVWGLQRTRQGLELAYSRDAGRPVRLVECGPGEVPMSKAAAAVVRAAVRECASHTETPGFCECDLCRAVERMKGRKR